MKSRMFSGDLGAVFRNMATLAIGSLLARLVGALSLPLLTRLYDPVDFGVMAVYTALLMIMMPILTLRYVLALPLPRLESEAMNLMALSTAIMLVSGAALTLVLAFFAGPILGAMSMEVLVPWWWLITLGLFGTGTYELLTYWATRKRRFKIIARTNVTQSLAGSAVKLGFGFLAPGLLGLLIGQLVSKSGGVVTLLRAFMGEIKSNTRHVRWSRVKHMALRHRGFPIFRMPSQLLLVFSQQAPLVFAITMFGPATAGQLSLALTVLALPLSLIGGSMGKALYGEAASIGMREPERLMRLVKGTQLRLFSLSIIPAAAMFLLGPPLFQLVFGAEWEMAGRFASILSIYLLFQFTSAPLMQIVNLLNAQHIFLLINAVRAGCIAILAYGSHNLGLSADQFVTAYSVFASTMYLAISIYVIRQLKFASAALTPNPSQVRKRP